MSLQHPAMFLILSAALLLLSARSLEPFRAQCFLALSVTFVCVQYAAAAKSLALLALSLIVHYAMLRAMARLPQLGRRMVFCGWLSATLAGFALLKQYSWITGTVLAREVASLDLCTVGFSFLLFRQVHLAVEVRDGAGEPVGALDYLNYNLAFWTFLAGPVQRFEDFRSQFARMSQAKYRPDTRTLLLALNRMATGFIKMFLIGSLLSKYSGCEEFLAHPSIVRLAILLLAFPLYVYINFSGYCDIMIGLARAVGFELTENFRRPYLARNSMDFWTRWHITLSEFFRDHLYFPLSISLARRLWPWLATSVVTLFSFMLMGAWHGNTIGFVVFGFMHGAGVLAALGYDAFLKSVFGNNKTKMKWYRANRPIHVASVLCFQTFVVLSFLPFQFGMTQMRAILHATLTLIGGY